VHCVDSVRLLWGVGSGEWCGSGTSQGTDSREGDLNRTVASCGNGLLYQCRNGTGRRCYVSGHTCHSRPFPLTKLLTRWAHTSLCFAVCARL
jgi:hypothetical protein